GAPRSSDRLTRPPPARGRSKSGAASPTARLVGAGAVDLLRAEHGGTGHDRRRAAGDAGTVTPRSPRGHCPWVTGEPGPSARSSACQPTVIAPQARKNAMA